MPTDSTQGAKLAPKPLVSLERCPSYQNQELLASLERALAPFGGMSHFVRPGARVLLKPNYVMAREAERGANTHPAFILAVAQLVAACGGVPMVADSPAFGTTESIARKNGMMALEPPPQGLPPLVTFRGGEWVKASGQTVRRLKIAHPVRQADLVINLPKFKAHRQMLLSVAVKNLFGCIPGRRKAWIHLLSHDDRDWFARMLVENYDLIRPGLTLVDGVIAMEGNGPSNGQPHPLELVMAGIDCVAIDRVAMELLGWPWRDLWTLTAAEAMGVGQTDLKRIELAGESLDKWHIEDFKLPELIPIRFSAYRVVRGWVRNLVLQLHGAKAKATK